VISNFDKGPVSGSKRHDPAFMIIASVAPFRQGNERSMWSGEGFIRVSAFKCVWRGAGRERRAGRPVPRLPANEQSLAVARMRPKKNA